MPISILVRTEGGEVVESAVPQPHYYKPISIPADSSQSFPMLRSIDPYGDTIFNSRQVRVLLSELEQVRKQPGVICDELVYVCYLALGRPHRYLWFIGD